MTIFHSILEDSIKIGIQQPVLIHYYLVIISAKQTTWKGNGIVW